MMIMNQKQNIEAPVLTGPKVVGKIDLGGNQPAPIAKKFVVFGNFPIEHYDRILELVKKVNNKLGKDSVTISKIAKIKGQISEKHGSIWYSCEETQFKTEFLMKYRIKSVEFENNCRRISKAEALAMPYGQTFCIGYMFSDNELNIKSSPCIRIFTTNKQEKDNLSYTKNRDTNQNVNLLAKNDINEDGTFNTNNSTGYLFVSNETFVGDL
jgi:hypothetical protein